MDVRYRVFAKGAVHDAPATFLVDEESGAKVGPIRPPRDPLGPLVQGGRVRGGIVLFDNRAGVVKAGSTVTLVVGGRELHGIRVAALMP